MLYATHALIHLQNIKANIEAIRSQVNRKILIAVKANAYGHGAVAVARLAEQIGVDFLGVATVPEGIELREAGITLPILKFSPVFAEEIAAAIQFNITLSVCDEENIDTIEDLAKKADKNAKIHLKVDTGMGRIGCSPTLAPMLAAHIASQCPHLELEGVFTHLPISDSPAGNEFTQNQLSLFEKCCAEVRAAYGKPVPLLHAANSGGVLAHQASWLNMVRPGIMIYGFYPDATTPQTIALKPGLSLCTRISFIKQVKKGTPIGYGNSWTAPEDTWIATFPAGYADGFNRLFSNRGRVLIGGKSYPVVGRVCMDQSMCNLGANSDAKAGDKVTLIGQDGDARITVEEWAKELNTITYEVTCQINSRVKRIPV